MVDCTIFSEDFQSCQFTHEDLLFLVANPRPHCKHRSRQAGTYLIHSPSHVASQGRSERSNARHASIDLSSSTNIEAFGADLNPHLSSAYPGREQQGGTIGRGWGIGGERQDSGWLCGYICCPQRSSDQDPCQ